MGKDIDIDMDVFTSVHVNTHTHMMHTWAVAPMRILQVSMPQFSRSSRIPTWRITLCYCIKFQQCKVQPCVLCWIVLYVYCVLCF